jgi:hypothetical protein
MADFFSWIAQQIQAAGGRGNVNLHFEIFVDFDWAANWQLVKNRGLKQVLFVWMKNSVITLYLGFEVIASHYL